LLHYIPQAALAGLLLITAVRLVDYRRLIDTVKASRYDAGLVFITALTGVLIDLDKAVLLGIGLSIVLFVPRAAKLKASELIVTPERVVRERIPGDLVDPSAVIYDLEGELFFGAAPDLDRYLDTLEERVRTNAAKFVVLRLKRVRHPDAVCVERLLRFVREQQEHGLTVLLAGVRPDTLTVLLNMGLQRWLPARGVARRGLRVLGKPQSSALRPHETGSRQCTPYFDEWDQPPSESGALLPCLTTDTRSPSAMSTPTPSARS
jgi:SulP family sulfate permease